MNFIGGKLFDRQREIVQSIVDTDEQDGSVSWHIVNCSRQFGKSYMLKQLLLYYSINEPGSKCLFVSMSHQQANKIFNEILKAVGNSPLIRKKNLMENSLILINGSEVYVRSYQRCDFIRGLSATTLIVDEAAYIKDEDFQTVLRPTLATVGKRGILFSTPRGKNFFYQMANMDKDNYHYYHATYRDNPFANLSEIEDARLTLPEKIFRSEYEAEFISGSMSVFNNIDSCIRTVLTPSSPCIAAIDVGRKEDFTVLTIMSGEKVVYIGRWNRDTWENIIRNICEQLKKFGVKICYVETNGVGDPFFEMLYKEMKNRRMNISLNGWTTTNVSKSNIIEKLIEDFATNNILIPDDKELLNELDHFTCEYSGKSKAVIYGGEAGYYDDCVMSLAICNYHRRTSGQYHIRRV